MVGPVRPCFRTQTLHFDNKVSESWKGDNLKATAQSGMRHRWLKTDTKVNKTLVERACRAFARAPLRLLGLRSLYSQQDGSQTRHHQLSLQSARTQIEVKVEVRASTNLHRRWVLSNQTVSDLPPPKEKKKRTTNSVSVRNYLIRQRAEETQQSVLPETADYSWQSCGNHLKWLLTVGVWSAETVFAISAPADTFSTWLG